MGVVHALAAYLKIKCVWYFEITRNESSVSGEFIQQRDRVNLSEVRKGYPCNNMLN